MSLDSRDTKSLTGFASSDQDRSDEDAPSCDFCGSEMEYSENAEAWLCWNNGCEGTKSVEEEEKGFGPVIVDEDGSETEGDIFL